MAEILTIYTQRGVASGAGKYVPLGGFRGFRGFRGLGQATTGSLVTAIVVPVAIAGVAAGLGFWMLSAMKGAKGTSGLGKLGMMTRQQTKFKSAAKRCKGRQNYRQCMSSLLRGR